MRSVRVGKDGARQRGLAGLTGPREEHHLLAQVGGDRRLKRAGDHPAMMSPSEEIGKQFHIDVKSPECGRIKPIRPNPGPTLARSRLRMSDACIRYFLAFAVSACSSVNQFCTMT